MKRVTIDISPRTLLAIIGLGLALWLFIHVLDVLVLVFISLILAAALDPLVRYLSRWLPRWAGVLVVFFTALIIFALAIYLLVPPLISQTRDLVDSFASGRLKFDFQLFGQRIDSASLWERLGQNFDQLSSHLETLLGATKSFLIGLGGVLTVIVLTLYILIDQKSLTQSVVNLVPEQSRVLVIRLAKEVGEKMGFWLRGQLALGLIIGVVSYIGLLIFGVHFALPLAVFAGVTELIPIIGPFLGAGAAILVALTQDWTTALLIGLWYLVIQQLEAHILVPQVMKRALGLSPVVIIIALLIGAKLYGLLGIILSIPVAAAVSVLVNEWPKISTAIAKREAQRGR